MMQFVTVFLSVFAIVAIANGGAVKGKSKQTTKVRDLETFEDIYVWDLNENFHLHYIQGNTHNVRITGDAKMVEGIKAEVVDGRGSYMALNVTTGNGGIVKPSKPIDIYITSVKVDTVILGELSACNFKTDKIVESDDKLEFFQRGSGNVALHVKAPLLSVIVKSKVRSEIIAQGEVNALHVDTKRGTKCSFNGALLKASEATVFNDGDNEVVLNVSGKLKIHSGRSFVRNVAKAG